jgi:hypothetical protein
LHFLPRNSGKSKHHEMGVLFSCQMPNERGIELLNSNLAFQVPCKRKHGSSCKEKKNIVESQDGFSTRPKKKKQAPSFSRLVKWNGAEELRQTKFYDVRSGQGYKQVEPFLSTIGSIQQCKCVSARKV